MSSWAGHSVLGASPEYQKDSAQRDASRQTNTSRLANNTGFSPNPSTSAGQHRKYYLGARREVPQMPFPSDPFSRHFAGGQQPRIPRQQREKGLGSGVIVRPDGYIQS
jgi:serine protease DegS